MGRFLVVVVALLFLAAPAQANTGDVIPTYDDGGEPTDVFDSNQALWAITSPDFNGGDVCVVPKTGTGFTCKSPAWGTKNHVFGVGNTTWLPLEGPYLRTGTWRLLGESASP